MIEGEQKYTSDPNACFLTPLERPLITRDINWPLRERDFDCNRAGRKEAPDTEVVVEKPPVKLSLGQALVLWLKGDKNEKQET